MISWKITNSHRGVKGALTDVSELGRRRYQLFSEMVLQRKTHDTYLS